MEDKVQAMGQGEEAPAETVRKGNRTPRPKRGVIYAFVLRRRSRSFLSVEADFCSNLTCTCATPVPDGRCQGGASVGTVRNVGYLIVPTAPTTFASAFGIITVVTFCAGCRGKVLSMTIAAGAAAVIHTTAALIGNARMRAIVSGEPVVRGVARGAVCTKHSGVEGRVTMATYARTGQARKLSIRMALLTSQPNMSACKRKV